MHHFWKRIFATFVTYYLGVEQKIRTRLSIPQHDLVYLLFFLWDIPVGAFAFWADSWYAASACDPLVFASFACAFHDGYFLSAHRVFECVLSYNKITLAILLSVSLNILPIIYNHSNILNVCQWELLLPSAGEIPCR